MPRREIVTLVSLLLIISFLVQPSIINEISGESQIADSMDSSRILSYIEHDPIHITSDNNFNDTASAEGWIGNGSVSNPYVISGYNITNDNYCINIENTAVSFIIRDCYFQSNVSDSGFGVVLDQADGGKIVNNTFRDFWSSLDIYWSTTVIANNTFLSNLWGISMSYSWSSTLENNTFMDDGESLIEHSNYCGLQNNSFYPGIALYESNGCSLLNNSFSSKESPGLTIGTSEDISLENLRFNQTGLHLEGAVAKAWEINITDVKVDGKDIGYFWNASDISVNTDNYGQLIFANCSNVTLSNFVSASPIGPQLAFCNNSVIERCDFEPRFDPLMVQDSINITVSNCTFNGSLNCLQIADALNVTFIGNTIDSLENTGVYAVRVSNSTFLENTIKDNEKEGFDFFNVSYSSISCNTFQNNEEDGVEISESGFTNITSNVFSSNKIGLEISELSNLTIEDNEFHNQRESGLKVLTRNEVEIRNNSFTNDGIFFAGRNLEDWFVVIEDCYLNGKLIGLFLNETNLSIDSSQFSQIILGNCNETTVSGGSHYNCFTPIQIGFSNDILLTDTVIDNCSLGWLFSKSTNCTVSESSVYQCRNTMFDDISRFNLTHCYFDNSPLILFSSENCSVIENEFINSGLTITGLLIEDYIHNIENNSVNGKTLGYYCNISNVQIDGSYLGELILVNSSNIEVYNLTGVYSGSNEFAFCNNCTMRDSVFAGNQRGFFVEQSSDITITNSRFFGNDEGVMVYGTKNCTITNNRIYSNRIGIEMIIISGTSIVNNNSIGWNAQGNAIDTFTSINWDGNYWSNYDGESVYELDQSNDVFDNNPEILVDELAPLITSPMNVLQEEGIGNTTLIWTINDDFSYQYSLERNNSEIEAGLIIHENLGFDLGQLEVGVYVFELVVSDGAGNQKSDSVTIEIVEGAPPVINHPPDMTIIYGAVSEIIIWNPSDVSGSHYIILQNGTQVHYSVWTSGDIEYDLTGLGYGVYNFTIIVYDQAGRFTSDTVIVRVVPEGGSTTTTTAPGWLPWNLTEYQLLLITIGGILFLITVVILIRRRR
ncbi:MAG: hypothetical protein BAJATHORv1_80051 [Candidatus Thorarchaeota archaeon]|nr:MAG: hypothetical protein BAJATHORv1_80051 [Candidatus Thorarchaeota archaeon]